MSLFRQLSIAEAKGTIYLHSMPGRFEQWRSFLEEGQLLNLDRVLCLTKIDEVRHLSPDYYKAIQKGILPFEWHLFDIVNFAAPDDWQQYADFIHSVAERIKEGESILIHCAAGIGRTGMVATSILLALGVAPEEAAMRTKKQGASPERALQYDVVRWFQSQVN